jgi:hypothetical protein
MAVNIDDVAPKNTSIRIGNNGLTEEGSPMIQN